MTGRGSLGALLGTGVDDFMGKNISVILKPRGRKKIKMESG
ncbi:hypothetical protein HMPREF0201_02694 [Cedecea davisae DSM 4568]|uniref:Uncharacterized protein n=1 Tax=Cedecea davisae DSM 4568 TaxID=566551 RepID=S3J8D8_9ENTR|nr:hypothetical protein HMPREF0201_02694 [Cedecea davisae DSM 4568]